MNASIRMTSLALAIGLVGCGGGGGGSSEPEQPPLPPEQETFSGRLFGLGMEVNAQGETVVYAQASDPDGAPVDVWNELEVSVDGTPVDPIAVAAVGAGDVMSIYFATDYSGSMPQAALQAISAIYGDLLSSLPAIWQAQATTFNTTNNMPDIRSQTGGAFTDDLAALTQAFQYDAGLQGGQTPLYDAVGVGVGGSTARGIDGLDDDGCRPVRLLLVLADGEENASQTYTGEAGLQSLQQFMAERHITPIMLGVNNADVATLSALAGDRGAFVFAHNQNGIAEEVKRYSSSLSQMQAIRLSQLPNDNVTLQLGEASVTLNVADFQRCNLGF